MGLYTHAHTQSPRKANQTSERRPAQRHWRGTGGRGQRVPALDVQLDPAAGASLPTFGGHLCRYGDPRGRVYVYVHVYVYLYIHVDACMYIYIYTYSRTCTWTCACTCTCTCMCLHVFSFLFRCLRKKQRSNNLSRARLLTDGQSVPISSTPSNPLFNVGSCFQQSVLGLRKKQRFPFRVAPALVANIEKGGAGGRPWEYKNQQV